MRADPEPATEHEHHHHLDFSPAFATIYLLVVSAAISVCCLPIMAATIRLCFGMSRDNQLPLSKHLSKVSPRPHTPVWACIAVTVVAAIPLIDGQYSGAGIIAIAATAMIYLSCFQGNLAILRARLKGWPKTPAPFSLAKWGLPINILGLLYGGAMLINFAWSRAASNPTPTQSGVLHLGFLDGVPIRWTVFAVVIVIGAIYYLTVGRAKQFAALVSPARDDEPLVTDAAALQEG